MFRGCRPVSDATSFARLRVRLFAVLGVVLMALAVWGAARIEHDVQSRHARQIGHGQAMLFAMLEQETALRGFLDLGDRES